MRQQLTALLVAVMLVTAGCSGLGGDSGPASEPSDGSSGDATGTVNFYISDQQNAIDDFEHLNVTISKVGFVPAENGTEANGTATGTDAEDGNETGVVEFQVDDRTIDLTELKDANATQLDQYDVPNGSYSQVYIVVGEVNGTLTDGSSAAVKLPSGKLRVNKEFTVGNNESVDFVYDASVVKRGNSGKYNIRPVAGESGTDVEIDPVDDESDGAEGDDESEEGMDDDSTSTATQQSLGTVDFYVSDQQNAIGDFEHLNVTVSQVGFQRGGESGSWTEFDVDNRTMDLTELQGANATQLDSFNVTNGTYTKVFIYVSEVNGTLTDGSSADVKLPSSKLQLNEQFEVGANQSVDFVYDITVVKRGNSGKYNIKPIASESGTDQAIEEVGGEDETKADGEETDESEPGEETGTTALNATFVGNVSAGENATVSVSRNGSAVENATVEYGETTYTTDAEGNVTFAVPADAEEVEVEVEYEGKSVTLKQTVEASDSGGESTASGSSDGSDTGDDSETTATATPTATASG